MESFANREVALALVGRKGRDFFMRRGFDVRYEEVNIFNDLKWSHAQAIAKTAIDEFLSPDVSSVYLVYNEFRSVISQRVVIERLLPIPKLAPESAAPASLFTLSSYCIRLAQKRSIAISQSWEGLSTTRCRNTASNRPWHL